MINTIRNLIGGGDKIIKIEAVLSGTLNWLLSEYDGTRTFSELVMIAKERGYTEPDPRDDLSGMDIARKCLILARESGITMELSDIAVDPLIPSEAAKAQDSEDFFRILKGFDDIFSSRLLQPRLTTVHVPISELGSSAVRYLFKMINGVVDPHQPYRNELTTGLEIGGSCGCNISNAQFI